VSSGAVAMQDWLRARARLSPGREALVCGGDALTFGELDRRVDAVAAALLARGVDAGDRVALLLRNGTPFVELLHAVPRAGGVVVPMNTRLTAPELSWQVAHVGAGLLVFDESTADLACDVDAAVLRVHADELRGDESGRIDAPRVADALHSIIYTSGTSGTPKGAMLTSANHWWSAIGSALNLGLREDDQLLACLPAFHVGGMAVLLRSVIYGNTAVVHESFDEGRVNRAIDDGVTIVSVVANMLQRMLGARGGRSWPASLRAVLLGGGPASRALLERCAASGLPVAPTYGLTEAASQVATLPPAEARAHAGSAGRPLSTTKLRIARDDGSDAAPGEDG
jgi:O-succinylbenzoic acid--CoA ligase